MARHALGHAPHHRLHVGEYCIARPAISRCAPSTLEVYPQSASSYVLRLARALAACPAAMAAYVCGRTGACNRSFTCADRTAAFRPLCHPPTDKPSFYRKSSSTVTACRSCTPQPLLVTQQPGRPSVCESWNHRMQACSRTGLSAPCCRLRWWQRFGECRRITVKTSRGQQTG